MAKRARSQELWRQWETLYTDLSTPLREMQADAFFEANQAALLEGSEVLWPEMEPYYLLMKMRINEGASSFNSEKQNEPYDPERQLFKMKQAKRFTWIVENNQIVGLRWLDGSNTVVPRSDFRRLVAFHDPALCEKISSRYEPDYAAIVVVAQDKHDYMYVLDAYIGKDAPTIQIERCFRLQEKWGFDTLYVETNGSQALMKQVYSDALEKRGSQAPLRVNGVHQTEDKYKRIATLEPDIANGYLLFADDLDPRLIEQLSYFPTSNDDGPDALYGAVRQLKIRPGSIKTIRRGIV